VNAPILIVEDNPLLRRTLGAIVERLAPAVVVEDFHAARALLSRSSFSIVLADLHVGWSTADTFLQGLCATKRRPPIVLMSGLVDVREVARRHGVPWIEKPFTEDELVAVLERERIPEGVRLV
jgi:DNA-binding response OmpR family regulator